MRNIESIGQNIYDLVGGWLMNFKGRLSDEELDSLTSNVAEELGPDGLRLSLSMTTLWIGLLIKDLSFAYDLTPEELLRDIISNGLFNKNNDESEEK